MSELTFSFYGRGGSLPIALLNDPILGKMCRELLFNTRHGIKLTELREVVIKPEEVRSIIEVYASLGILVREDDVIRPAIPILSEEEKHPFMEHAMELSKVVKAYVMRHLEELRRKFKLSSLPSQGFKWEDIRFTLIAGMLLDMSLFNALHELKIVPPPPPRPDGGSWYLWCLQGGSGAKIQYGVHITRSSIGGFGAIWVKGVLRSMPRVYGDALRIAQAMALSPKAVDELVYELKLPREYIEKTLKEWINHGIALQAGDRFKVLFPVLLPEDYNIVHKSIERMSREVVDNILRRYVSSLLRLKYRLGYAHVEDGSYLVMMFQAVKHFAVSGLVEEGILEDPLKTSLPPRWGLWAWIVTH